MTVRCHKPTSCIFSHGKSPCFWLPLPFFQCFSYAFPVVFPSSHGFPLPMTPMSSWPRNLPQQWGTEAPQARAFMAYCNALTAGWQVFFSLIRGFAMGFFQCFFPGDNETIWGFPEMGVMMFKIIWCMMVVNGY